MQWGGSTPASPPEEDSSGGDLVAVIVKVFIL